MWHDIEDFALKYSKCPRCAAPPGMWCKTNTGKIATSLHAGRTWPWHDCWIKGYEVGEKDTNYMNDLARRR